MEYSIADQTELEQVVMNLCTNAAHAMDGHGTIRLALRPVAIEADRTYSHGELLAGQYVELTVADTGYGIDAPILEKIIEPFFTTKPAGQGTGLGLSTVHGILTQ